MWYVANWKMYMTFRQERDFFSLHHTALNQLAEKASLVICPSFMTLGSLANSLVSRSFFLGAQHVSSFNGGAYTGEVCMASLAEAGASFVLIGHSERRAFYYESDELLSAKIAMAWKSGITPILCVGESKECYDAGDSVGFILKQLDVLLDAMQKVTDLSWDQKKIFVAYEPIFSIGSGILASSDHLAWIIAEIRNRLEQKVERDAITMLYGGSVGEKNSADLKKINGIQGFLIGKSSINFAELKKIIDT